jgi:hypothetical protein
MWRSLILAVTSLHKNFHRLKKGKLKTFPTSSSLSTLSILGTL